MFEIEKVAWQKMGGLMPAIIQHAQSGKVLMLGYMNIEALQQSLLTKEVIFYSRSKKRLWKKGEVSGNTLAIVEVSLDCDQDSLLILALPVGNTCHLGRESCFQGEKISSLSFICELEKTIANRKKVPKESSYVNHLLAAGLPKITQKVGEEAVETVIAALVQSEQQFLNEAADLIFHLLVLLAAKGYSLLEVITILQGRASNSR